MLNTLSENPIEKKVLEFIRHAENHEKYQDQRERAELCAEFEQGKQWSEDQYNRYREVGVEPVVINRCLATIKALDGLYQENRQEITCIPRRGGTEVSARVKSGLIKHALDEGGFEDAAARMFTRGNIQTAAYIEIDIDKTKTANGEIVFRSYGFFDVMVDPDCTDYDMDKPGTGAKYIIVRKWIDKEILNALYDEAFGVDYKAEAGAVGGPSNIEAYISAVQEKSSFYLDNEKQYRLPVYVVWWKEYIKGVLVGDKKTGKTRILTDSKEMAAARKQAKKSKRFTAEDVAATVLHKSTVINNKMVEDKEHPWGENIDTFPIVRYVPIFREDYERGILDDAVPINREENLRRTQVNRLLIVTANAGWIHGQVTDPQALLDLKQYGSTPGFTADKSKFSGHLEKIKPNEIPGDFILAKQSATDIKEVTGLNAAMQGYDEGTKNEPGVVLHMRREQGVTANSGLFNNLRVTLELLGNRLLAILCEQDVYTEEEVRAILDEAELIDSKLVKDSLEEIYRKIGTRLQPPQPLPPVPPQLMASMAPDQMRETFETIQIGIKGAQMYAEQYPQLAEQMQIAAKEKAVRKLLEGLKDKDLRKYGIKVTLSPSSPTARFRNFQQTMAIQDKYGFVPPAVLLKHSDLPDKDEIIEYIERGMAMQRLQPAQAAQPRQPQRVQGEVAA